MFVPIALESTGSALEDLAPTKLVVDHSALPAGLASVGLTDDYDFAPWVLSSLVDESLLKPIVRQSGHGTSRLASDSPLSSSNHALSRKLWQ